MKSGIIILFMLLVILGGCSSGNEKKVFSLLNDQIVKQNECNTNNQAVTDLMSEETIIYNDIIEQGFESGNEVQGLIEEAWTNVKNSQVYLEEYQTCILNTQVNPEKLKKVNENIADEEIRANTEKLIQEYTDNSCFTRLRVTVKDGSKVADLAAWKAEGAQSLFVKGNGIQAVYGPKADVLKSDINDIL